MAGTKAGAAKVKRRGWPAFRPDQVERIRGQIDSHLIINRLQNHVVGSVKMEQSQVSAALGLLRKVVPDLASVDLTTGGGGPLIVEILRFAPPDEPPTIDVTPNSSQDD